MMSPESNDLSPRMSIESLSSSLSFDRDSKNTIDPSTPSNAMGTPSNNSMVLEIREEDLVLLSNTMEQALNSADETLRGLEADRELLPLAILRKCQEIADGLGSLAGELESKSEEERRMLAEAIRDDLRLFEESGQQLQQQLQQQQQEQDPDQSFDTIGKIEHRQDEEVVFEALSEASALLRDVEAAFREIGDDEAEEIADAALIMARLFLLSLQNLQWNLSKQLTSDFDKEKASTVWIEELEEDNNNPVDEQPTSNNKPRYRKSNPYRMRVLWPPLGPKVDGAMAWTKEEATRRPFLAVALGLTLWPVAISTALLGTSLSFIDGALQENYERFQDGPWISFVEEGAAQAYQTGRLAVATGKLVGRQSLRVASRQIERRGGLQSIAQELGGMAMDRITHPIDTIGKIWGGFHRGFGFVRDTTQDFLRMRRESQEALIWVDLEFVPILIFVVFEIGSRKHRSCSPMIWTRKQGIQGMRSCKSRVAPYSHRPPITSTSQM